jgi:hypothetical protein
MASYNQDVANRQLDAMIAAHANDAVIQSAGPVEKMQWLTEHPYLAGMAGWGRLSLNDLLLADMSHSYDWGVKFERDYKRPPTMDDWRAGYYGRANQVCELLGMQPAFNDDNRIRLEYGGPF